MHMHAHQSVEMLRSAILTLSVSLSVNLLCQRDLLVTEVEDSGGVDSCLRFLDAAAGQWPTAVALSLLRLALDCTASRHRSRPSMENVSTKSSFLTFRTFFLGVALCCCIA